MPAHLGETATGSQRGSQHRTQTVMKHPPESAGYLPRRREEPGFRSTLPSGLIPLWADATLTSLNAFCLLSELQQRDAWKSVRCILRCSDAQTLTDGFHQRGESETACCPSLQSQLALLMVQTKPIVFLYLQVCLCSLEHFIMQTYGAAL